MNTGFRPARSPHLAGPWVAVSFGMLCLMHSVAAKSDERATANANGATKAEREFALTETYFAQTKANVYVREKTVTSQYNLIAASQVEEANKRGVLVVNVTKIKSHVEVPAQKRQGAFDSSQNDVDSPLPAYELVRPASFIGGKFSLKSNPSGALESISGLDSVQRKFAELFDRDFRGTEFSDHARDCELSDVGPDRLAQTWGRLFFPDLKNLVADPADPVIKFQINACVPSESWTLPLQLECRLKSVPPPAAPGANLSTTAYRGEFSTSQPTKATIGPCGWSYQVASGTYDSKFTRDSLGELTESEFHIDVKIDSTVELDARNVLVQMELRQDMRLTRQ